MRVRVLAVLCTWAALGACDLYESGYEAGYGFADFFLTAAEEREAVQNEWRSACGVPVETLFDEQRDLEAADEHCRDRSPTRDRLTVCTDPGQEPGSHPGDCVAFRAPLVVPMASDYRCPTGVDGALLCLCCGGDRDQTCGLRGDACSENADCCEGGCSVDASGDGECL